MPKNAICKKAAPIGTWNIMGREFTLYGTVGQPLILAKDIAIWIDYNKNSDGKYNVSQMVELLDEDEKLVCLINIPGQNQNRRMWFVTEDGLYELLMLNRTEQGKRFKKEVKHILKHLRENGAYIVKYKDKHWNEMRLSSKEARKNFTDTLKEFVEYAQEQGSTNYKRYYTIFTRLINDRLSIPKDLEREELSELALKQLERYEQTIGNYIHAKIMQGIPYKEIYRECKELIVQI